MTEKKAKKRTKKTDLCVDILIENLDKIKKSMEDEIIIEIEDSEKARDDKNLENELEYHKSRIEEIEKFLRNGGWEKRIETLKNKLKSVKESEIVLEKNKPLLLDFYANWCEPCRRIGLTVEKLKERYNGLLGVLQVNTETQEGMNLYKRFADPFKINAIPYLVVFDSNGRIFEQIIGSDETKLIKAIESVVKPA